MSKVAAYLPLALAAALGNEAMLSRGLPYRVGVTSAKLHDDERKRKAAERRARRQAARPNAKIYPADGNENHGDAPDRTAFRGQNQNNGG